MTESRFTFDMVAGPNAFGDGLHPTTAGMLEVVQEISGQGVFRNILDMGCGAGLLSMAAASVWPLSRIVAVDYQASAVETARQNFLRNGCEGQILAAHGDGYRQKDVLANALYDLVLANMTADVHAGLAAQMPAVLAEGALVVLGGILRWREEDILALYAQQGMELIAEPIRDGEWSLLLLEYGA